MVLSQVDQRAVKLDASIGVIDHGPFGVGAVRNEGQIKLPALRASKVDLRHLVLVVLLWIASQQDFEPRNEAVLV